MTLDIGYLLPSDRSISASTSDRKYQSNVHGPANYNTRYEFGSDTPAYTIGGRYTEIDHSFVPGPGKYMPRYVKAIEVKSGIHPLTYQKIKTNWLRDVEYSGGPSEFFGHIPDPIKVSKRRASAHSSMNPYPYKYINKKKRKTVQKSIRDADRFYRRLENPKFLKSYPLNQTTEISNELKSFIEEESNSSKLLNKADYIITGDDGVEKPLMLRSQSQNSMKAVKGTPFGSQVFNINQNKDENNNVTEKYQDPYKNLKYENENPIGNILSTHFDMEMRKYMSGSRTPRSRRSSKFTGLNSQLSQLSPNGETRRRLSTCFAENSSFSRGSRRQSSVGFSPVKSGSINWSPILNMSVDSDIHNSNLVSSFTKSSNCPSELGLDTADSSQISRRFSNYTPSAARSRRMSTVEMKEFGDTKLKAKLSVETTPQPKFRYTLTDRNRFEDVEYDFTTELIQSNPRARRLSEYAGVTTDLNKQIGAGELYRKNQGPKFTFYTKRKSMQSVVHF